ncbi:MAG TPA: hypothetical protein VD770_01605, partial [Coxiellaceae bacterium]|nr:hypothetical protein [Coxiellaceae bacterium]
KDFYEPNQIIIDATFLESLSPEQIKIGLGEIIKHGVFQSESLLKFIGSATFDPVNSRRSLLKAILWTAALKRICLEIDPEETPEGSEIILRGAHKHSDMLEESSKFSLPHGLAVAIALYSEVKDKYPNQFSAVDAIYDKFELPKTY